MNKRRKARWQRKLNHYATSGFKPGDMCQAIIFESTKPVAISGKLIKVAYKLPGWLGYEGWNWLIQFEFYKAWFQEKELKGILPE